MENLKKKLEEAIQEAVSEVSCDTKERFFVGSVKFVVDGGWTDVKIIDLNSNGITI